MTIRSHIDHLVIAAATLQQGVDWCESTLGLTPGPGGAHPLMGTHNRLFSVASQTFPDVYFEIIAIEPGAPSLRPAGYKRWFDLDDSTLQASLASSGPQLIHLVARTAAADDARHALQALDIDRGELVAASRPTPQGLLSWKITVRPDGQRLFAGALPTVIEWGAAHPARGMPPSGVVLQSLTAVHPQSDQLQTAYRAIGLDSIAVQSGPANLIATLQTSRGLVTLESTGI